MGVGRLGKVILNPLILTQEVFFFFDGRAGCSSQVQINVKCLGGFPGWLLLAGGCSLQVVARAG